MRSELDSSYLRPEAITRERILDGCVSALDSFGLEKLRMKHIIESSGLSKQTIYNHYKNQRAVLLDAYTREGERLSRGCAEQIRAFESLEDKFVMGMVYVHDSLPANPLLREIVTNHAGFLSALNLDAIPLEQFGRLCFSDVIQAHPALAVEFSELADYWSRSVLSLLFFRSTDIRGSEQLIGYIRRRLVPGLNLAAVEGNN